MKHTNETLIIQFMLFGFALLSLLYPLELNQLDQLPALSTSCDKAKMLNKCAYLLAACHDDIIFHGVIIDRNGSMFFP